MNKLRICRRIPIILSLILIFMCNTEAMASPEQAQKFVETVSHDALNIMTSGITSQQKEKDLTSLFIKSVGTEWIARFVIGKYWNNATEAQRGKYLEAHRKFLLSNYIPKFKEYNGQKVKIIKSYQDCENEYVVETQIVSSDGTSVNIGYKIRKYEDGKYMIFDVIAEGVSLIITQRADFSSVLERGGVDELITMLEKRAQNE